MAYTMSSFDGHLYCFYILAFLNNTTLNTDVQGSILVPDFNSSGYIPRSQIAGS